MVSMKLNVNELAWSASKFVCGLFDGIRVIGHM
jgi:hypothetical protein